MPTALPTALPTLVPTEVGERPNHHRTWTSLWGDLAWMACILSLAAAAYPPHHCTYAGEVIDHGCSPHIVGSQAAATYHQCLLWSSLQWPSAVPSTAPTKVRLPRLPAYSALPTSLPSSVSLADPLPV